MSLKLKAKRNEKKILFIGITFKENVDDIRNSKVLDMIDKLSNVSKVTHIYDPLLNERKFVEINNKNSRF